MKSDDDQDKGASDEPLTHLEESDSAVDCDDVSCDEDDSDYLIHGGEYELEDRPLEDDYLPEFDD